MSNKTKLGLALTAMLITSIQAQVLPNDAIVDGKSIGDWSAEWWKWVLPIPIAENPMLDTNGVFAAVGQPEGDVFFLAFNLGIDPIHSMEIRSFSVREDKYLFFPLEMYEADNVDSCPPCYTIDELRAQAAAVIADISELHASIDGVPVPNLFDHRALSPVFNIFYTNADNIHSFAFGHPVIGLIDPMVCDGYWLMVAPLPPGQHVLHFGGSHQGALFYATDILDYITVVPIPLSERVDRLSSTVEAASLGASRKHPLLVSLNAAKASFISTNLIAGINQLNAFENKVRAQVARSNPDLADELLQAAQRIIDRASAQLNPPQRNRQ